jgi:hypothetical protein
MISASEAVDTLLVANKGVYSESKYNTTERVFKPSYSKDVPGFINDLLFNKVLSTYMSHEWINK